MAGLFVGIPLFTGTYTGNERFPVDTQAVEGAPPQSGYVTLAQIAQAVATATGGTVNAWPTAQTPLGSGEFTDGLPALDTPTDDDRFVLDVPLTGGAAGQTQYTTWATLIAAIAEAI